MKDLIGTHDIALITLDTLRYDVAAQQLASGQTPHLAAILPGGQWERRHTPASFTYAAHHAFFAGFLPTPVSGAGNAAMFGAGHTPVSGASDAPVSGASDTARAGASHTPVSGQCHAPVAGGGHVRLFAAGFAGSETMGLDTWVFDEADVVTALGKAGYHTLCLGGVGFFNQRSALGSVLPGLFAEAHWRPEFGVTDPDSLRHQLDQLAVSLSTLPPEQPLFTFLNVSAMHQPNKHYLPGALADSLESHGAALSYVDSLIPRLCSLLASRGRACLVIMCSDHGTAYGEDGKLGHRLGHEVVWTVPYAHFTLPARER